MPALVAGIYVFVAGKKTWMAGTSPAMTHAISYLEQAEHKAQRYEQEENRKGNFERPA